MPFRGDLLDPKAAQIEIHKIGYFVSKAACGTINAKNSLGGYVGPRPFVITFTGLPPTMKLEEKAVVGDGWEPGPYNRSFEAYAGEQAEIVSELCSHLFF